jgi:hypothetical protein
MKALILNCSIQCDTDLESVDHLIQKHLKDAGWEPETLLLRNFDIAPCMGCFGCWVKTPGMCVIEDHARAITERMIQCDLQVFLTPVTFGGYSSELKKILDRSIGLISPFFMRIDGEIHHKPRYTKYPDLLAIGILPENDADSEAIFRKLAMRNAINFHSPRFAAGILHENNSPDVQARTIEELIQKLESGNE